MFRLSLLVTGCLLAVALGAPLKASAQAEKFLFRTHTAKSGFKLPYRIFIPPTYVKGTAIPLVLALHGSGERGSNNTSQLSANRLATLWAHDTVQNRFPSIVVAPQCPLSDTWVQYYQPVDRVPIKPPLQAVVEMLDSLGKEFTLDAGRHYLVGLSMGAFASWELLARHPGRFAAAVPICGWGDTTKASLMKTTPLWVFHGARDEVVSVEGSRAMVKALKAVGATPEPKYTEYPQSLHDSWTPALKEPELPGWLFAQRKPGGTAVRNPATPVPEHPAREAKRLLRPGEAAAPGSVRADGRAADRRRSLDGMD